MRAVEALEHQADRLAVGGGHQLDGRLRQAGLAQAAGKAHLDGAAGVVAVRAAAQDRRVAGLEAERAGVRRHVRPALVDDADDAERHAHALDLEAVGPRPVCEHAADRDRAARRSPPAPWPWPRRAWHRASAGRGRRPGGWPRAAAARSQPLASRMAAVRARNSRAAPVSAAFLALGRKQAPARAPPRAPAHPWRAWRRRRSPASRASSVSTRSCPQALLNTMSSRCTSSVRPAWPRMAAISLLFLPMMRSASSRA